MKSNRFPCLPQIWSLVWCVLGCCLLFCWVWLFWISDLLACTGAWGWGAEASLLGAAGARGLSSSPAVRSFLCNYLSCRCLVSLRAQPAPFEYFGNALWFSAVFSNFPLYRGRSYKCLRTKEQGIAPRSILCCLKVQVCFSHSHYTFP